MRTQFHLASSQIDGALLAQIDETMLAEDLGVTSKLHQKKLLLHVQLLSQSIDIFAWLVHSFAHTIAPFTEEKRA